MYKGTVKKAIENKLLSADIKLNGTRPWDIHVHDERFFPKVLSDGSLGMGEAYMEGWIEAQHLDESICRILQSPLPQTYNFVTKAILNGVGAFFWNKQTKKRAVTVAKEHYDLSNDLFEAMLDKRMTYSCAYWRTAKTLDEAQEAKLDLICQKLGIKPGSKVLDIGCGWGSFAKFAAEKYQAQVVGVTISIEQLELARERCRGLPVELRFQDYRDVKEKFDFIVSVGQFEHVGYKNYRTYMKKAAECLKDDGLFLLHTIGSNRSVYSGDPWMEKYIFPNSMLPSITQIAQSIEGLFIMEDWHNFSAYYDKTLLAWHHNFEAAWPRLKHRYDDRFYRMWRYYLLACAGAFRSRHMQLWQVVLSKKGVAGGYLRPFV